MGSRRTTPRISGRGTPRSPQGETLVSPICRRTNSPRSHHRPHRRPRHYLSKLATARALIGGSPTPRTRSRGLLRRQPGTPRISLYGEGTPRPLGGNSTSSGCSAGSCRRRSLRRQHQRPEDGGLPGGQAPPPLRPRPRGPGGRSGHAHLSPHPLAPPPSAAPLPVRPAGLAEVQSDDFPGERLIVCRNPERVAPPRTHRSRHPSGAAPPPRQGRDRHPHRQGRPLQGRQALQNPHHRLLHARLQDQIEAEERRHLHPATTRGRTPRPPHRPRLQEPLPRRGAFRPQIRGPQGPTHPPPQSGSRPRPHPPLGSPTTSSGTCEKNSPPSWRRVEAAERCRSSVVQPAQRHPPPATRPPANAPTRPPRPQLPIPAHRTQHLHRQHHAHPRNTKHLHPTPRTYPRRNARANSSASHSSCSQ